MTIERLVGGITADMDRIVIRAGDGRYHRVVLRRWTNSKPWTDGLVERESAALRALSDQNVHAPRLLAADPTGEHHGGEQMVFSHGDYQHFNILWTGEKVSGVVDWTMVGTGSMGIDVGHCLLNLAVLISAQAAETYLECYERNTGTSVDPRAELRALLCWSPDWLEFIPRQVAGRAPIDLAGMPDRVVETVQHTLSRLG